MREGRLSLRVPAIVGEPAHGLIRRLAARHGREDARAFATACGLSMRSLLAGHGGPQLAELAGIGRGGLAAHTPAIDPRGRTVRLNGQRITLGDWSVSTRRWCGACLAEDRAAAQGSGQPDCFHMHHRSWWDVRSIASCPRHGSTLRDACASCGRRQGWNGWIDRCRCGSTLLWAPEAPGTPSTADAYLAGRIVGGRAPATRLDRLAYDDAVRLLDRVGAVAGWSRFRPQPPRHGKGRGTIRDRGMSVLSDWPDGFRARLDAVLRTTPPGTGLLARYGWVHEFWIKDLPAEAFGDELRRELRRHAVGNAIVAADEIRLGHVPAVATVNATAAARILGMGYDRARRTLEREGSISPGSRRGVAFPVRRSVLASVQAAGGVQAGLAGISAVFGVGRGQARRIAVSAGVRSGRGRYDREAASRYLARLRGYARRPGGTSMRTVPLPDACRAVGLPLQEACAAIEGGRLRVAVGPAPGMAGLRVDPADLRGLASGRGLSIEMAAARLGIHHEVARALVRTGHIVSRGGIRGVGEDEVERFRARYVPAAELARTLGTSPRNLLLRFGEMGLEPEIGPPGCRAAFFRRDPAVALATRMPRAPGSRRPPGRRRAA